MPSGACRKWARVRLSWHCERRSKGSWEGCFPGRIPVGFEGGEGWDLNRLTRLRAHVRELPVASAQEQYVRRLARGPAGTARADQNSHFVSVWHLELFKDLFRI